MFFKAFSDEELEQFNVFIEEKKGFFLNQQQLNAQAKKFKHLHINKLLIEEEFTQLYNLLRRDNNRKVETMAYCRFCCEMLKAYYEGYDHPAKIREYEGYLKKIDDKFTKKKYKNFFEKIKGDLVEISNFRPVTNTRSIVSTLNLYRIYWLFCRLTLTKSFTHAQNIPGLEKLLGKTFDSKPINGILEAPTAIFTFLSVGFFATLFILQAGMLLKHTFFPQEKEKELTHWERFCSELYKRHPDLLNCIVWGTVNAVTGYAHFFHLSDPVANAIIAPVLVFDLALIFWKRQIAREEYLFKRRQYDYEIKKYNEEIKQHFEQTDKTLTQQQFMNLTYLLKQVHNQRDEDELEWQVKDCTFYFNASAAVLLGLGYSASLLFLSLSMPAATVVACYAICILAMAIYMSDGAYKKYKEKSLRYEHNLNDEKYREKYQKASINLAVTLVKNTILPSLLIMAYAVCWEAAILLTLCYVAIEFINRYYDKPKPGQGIFDDTNHPAAI